MLTFEALFSCNFSREDFTARGEFPGATQFTRHFIRSTVKTQYLQWSSQEVVKLCSIEVGQTQRHILTTETYAEITVYGYI